MITPQFSLRQSDQFLYVEIRAPYIKASQIQFEVEGDLFVFSLPPYYLRLHLPGEVVEDEHMNSSYDLETSTIRCQVSKKQRGEHFADLEMLSKLLARKQGPKIEELDPEAMDENVDFEEIEQTVHEPLLGPKYGFNNSYNEIVGVSVEAGNEINELEDCEHASIDAKRRQDSLVGQAFDADYYFSDLYENPMIEELTRWEWQAPPQDQDRMGQLEKRSIVATDPKATYVGLVGLLFGQAYDYRTNQGDVTVESAWCVGKLCPLMSCLLPFGKVDQLVVSCTRRSLVFPLYRSWDLSIKVWGDVLRTIQAGRAAILNCLVHLLKVFENDQHLCYRKIWLQDYALFIQYASDKVVAGLGAELDKALGALNKDALGMDLVEYEQAAQEALDEQAASGDSDDD